MDQVLSKEQKDRILKYAQSIVHGDSKIMFLYYGGSIAYGTYQGDDSDIDVNEIETFYIDFDDSKNFNEFQYRSNNNKVISWIYEIMENLHCSEKLTPKKLSVFGDYNDELSEIINLK